MAGRKPMGPKLVEHLQGSEQAKERLEVMLQTIAGELSIAEACARLGIGEAMFHRLRREVLQAGLVELEPVPLGRPPKRTTVEEQRICALEETIDDMRTELGAAQIKLELAQALPQLVAADQDSLKKTTVGQTRQQRQAKLREWNQRRKRRSQPK